MKKIILFLSSIMLLSCGNQFDVPEVHPKTYSEPVAVQQIPNWAYSSKTDEMESSKVYYAECFADNTILFDFPYNQEGGSTFELYLRKNKGFDIGLNVSKGQFMSGYSDRVVKLKFDDEKPFTVGYNSPSDGSSETIFLNNTSKILKKLKTAKKLKIEVEFYDYGNQIINFTVGGLKWDHK